MSPSAKDREQEASRIEEIKEQEAELLLTSTPAEAPKQEEVQPPTDDLPAPPPTALDSARSLRLSGSAEDFPLADAGPYYIGLWCGRPNYGCPYCLEKHLANTPEEGNGVIELHILSRIDQNDARHMEALNV